ncbi:hypothetical protein QJQ45_019569 [Haematococcus lacustris]|nr:hypothetical protein QJQ45_019569 [Haematococcus lacustris]
MGPAPASAPAAAAAETACKGNGTDAGDGTTPGVQPDAKRVKLEPAVVEGSITSDVKLEEGGAAGTGKEGKAEAEDKVAEAEGKVPEAEGKVAEAEGKVPGKVECKEEEMAADEPLTSVPDVAQAASVTQAANITPGKQGLSEVEVAARLARAERAAEYTEMRLRGAEKRVIDFRGKTVLAPLTTVGNLPFRRVCKLMGADVTIGEMALATKLLQGQPSEWALLKRHPSEDMFGVQIAGGFPDAIARTCQLIDECCDIVDWVDINMGCPIDIVCDRGAGSALLLKPKKIKDIAEAADRSMSLPLTLKTRKGYYDDQDVSRATWSPPPDVPTNL